MPQIAPCRADQAVKHRTKAAKEPTRKRCPTCAHKWYDHWGRDECPKCLTPLSRPGARTWGGSGIDSCLRESMHKFHDADAPVGARRAPGEASSPCRAARAASQAATSKAPHTANDNAKPTKKKCPTCAHKWTDYHGFDQCPKCLCSLSRPGAREWGGCSAVGSTLREGIYIHGGLSISESFTTPSDVGSIEKAEALEKHIEKNLPLNSPKKGKSDVESHSSLM